jgi:hypothetical protein
MPSDAHQLLLLWGVRRMLADGFSIAGFDGATGEAIELSGLPAPFELEGVRADAWGIENETGLIGFAEAKTARDINNNHTRKQLRILGRARVRGSLCPLYLAVPRACAYDLDRVLIDTGLIGARHIRRIHVPQVLLEPR